MHPALRAHFTRLLELCEAYKQLQSDQISTARRETRVQAVRLRVIAAIAIAVSILLAALVAFVLVHQILTPVRELVEAAGRATDPSDTKNLVVALRRGVYGLIENVGQVRSELAQSREHLLQAEKMALVGRLAAGMAHSIRNPFTAVQMRLFSLRRSLDLTAEQREDFAVVSGEIRRIDNIIQNFLEFSRPPRLQMRAQSPSSVVDAAVRLLEHRFKVHGVTVTLQRDGPLPAVQLDPDQLQEVLVNLMVNACEAMPAGGEISIREQRVRAAGGTLARIRVSDSGPGIAENLGDKVMQPFFTTKEQGTGLGLSIAARIVAEHGGRLKPEPAAGRGAVFTIELPLSEARDEPNSHH